MCALRAFGDQLIALNMTEGAATIRQEYDFQI